VTCLKVVIVSELMLTNLFFTVYNKEALLSLYANEFGCFYYLSVMQLQYLNTNSVQRKNVYSINSLNPMSTLHGNIGNYKNTFNILGNLVMISYKTLLK
jgi:hypothetical protein